MSNNRMNVDHYWCHQCGKEIVISSPSSISCPDCNSDFIEIIEPQEENTPQNIPADTETLPNQPNQPPPPQQGPVDLIRLMHQMAEAFTQPPPPPNSTPSQQSWHPFFGSMGTQGNGNYVFQTSGDMNNINETLTRLSSVINQFISSPDVGNSFNIFGPFGAPLHGNLGDYAWGNSFDDLLNRLFVNSGSRGTPPASSSTLESLPQVTIEQGHVEEGLDCAICKDEFQLNENVTELPCCHKFHKECITRWLNLHNQCPVCRHELPTDDADYERRRRGGEDCRFNRHSHT